MFTRSRNAVKIIGRSIGTSSRTSSGRHDVGPTGSQYVAATPLAEELANTGLYDLRRKKRIGDKRRVHVVEESVCDDVFSYLGSSLDRHVGCDILDLNPGAGLWSRKLHERLQPRKHIMVEPELEVYKPFVEDLLAKDNVVAEAVSPFVWTKLLNVLDTHLSHHPVTPPGATPERNDELLVTMNLCMYPKRAFANFENIATMFVYQFLNSIPKGALFHRYGLVRMLVWMNEEDRTRVLPQVTYYRRQMAFEQELHHEWVRQVTGPDKDHLDSFNVRDKWIDIESGYQTLQRMEAAGRVPPRGRAARAYKLAMADRSLMGQELAGKRPIQFIRPLQSQIEKLGKKVKSNPDKANVTKLSIMKRRSELYDERGVMYTELLKEVYAARELAATSPAEFAVRQAELQSRIEGMVKNPAQEFLMAYDTMQLFRTDPPTLHWDRREYEPLVVDAKEAYPNSPMCLIDFQPKATHPLLRHTGPGSDHAGDFADAMLAEFFKQRGSSLPRVLNAIWPGADEILDTCPTLRNPTLGGNPFTTEDLGIRVRSLNANQWIEILQAWMDWPFRPAYSRLVGRLAETTMQDEWDEDGGRKSLDDAA
ncbi:hypothetical protein B0I35DRAFT_426168 [Stachybotrys elegans]|uniref:Mitochondrial transcription factor 1 n=1 Tax=Stachybotrys elegans TaxID=80388 RepID=A0A8K0SRF0_9HYPO|nr:hypothetical protein B0I35DRAFT_426168 [Stachybotrys elegans]